MRLILGAILGAVAGSAATALANRYRNLQVFVTGRSACDSCGRQLRWVELIPIVSWVSQRGRCRTCRAVIGWPVLAVEVGATVAGALLATLGLTNWFLAWSLLLLVVLGALVIVDIQAQLLPDRLIIGALPFVILTGLTRFPGLTIPGALLGALVAGGLIGGLWFLTKGQGMGLGDAKLAAVLGLGLGLSNSLIFLFCSFVVGALVGLLLMVAGRARFGQRLAFGPFLIVGYIATLAVGPAVVAWYSGYDFLTFGSTSEVERAITPRR